MSTLGAGAGLVRAEQEIVKWHIEEPCDAQRQARGHASVIARNPDHRKGRSTQRLGCKLHSTELESQIVQRYADVAFFFLVEIAHDSTRKRGPGRSAPAW